MRSLFSLLTAPASHGFCLLSSFSHIFTLSHPTPSHPSASLLLNLEIPPLFQSPSSRSVFFLSCYMSQIPVMFLPSDHWPTSLFFFFWLRSSLLPVLPDVCPSVGQLLPFPGPCFTKRSVTYISDPKAKNGPGVVSLRVLQSRFYIIIWPVMFQHDGAFWGFFVFLWVWCL